MTDKVDSWYSCVVVAVGFVIFFMGYGIVRISGLFFSDIISHYHVDRERASTPFLLGSVARSISGPVSGYLNHKFGFRFTILLGCFLSSLGIFACSFARDINVFSVFWTVYGLGYGLSTAIFPWVVNLYVKDHATKANGIAMSGVSIAGIILPFITVALLNTYGMSGTFLNLSAIMLNTIPGVLLLRERNFNTLKENDCEKNNFKTDIRKEDKIISEEKHFPSESLEIGLNCKTCSLMDCKYPMLCKQNQLHVISDQKRPPFEELSLTKHDEGTVKPRTGSNNFIKIKNGSYDNITETNGNANKNISISKDGSFNGTNKTLQSKPLNKCFPEPSNTENPIAKKPSSFLLLSILWDPLFLIFSFLRGFCALLFIIVPTILVDFSIDKGMEINQTTYVLLAYSLGDLFGKACLGWITDGKHMSRIRYSAVSFCVIAFSCGLMAWSNGFAVMTVASFLQSMGVATMFATICVLVSEYFTREKQSMAIASLELFLLPMSFVTAPLIGYFRDDLGSYDGLAYILGAVSVFCSVLVLLVPCISKWRK